MRTEIAAFCQEYDSVLSPLVGELKQTSDCIEDESRANELRSSQAGLLDAGMRLKSLADKIKGQQAYLLIFGPLKSGKSTLMNAISGTYVSEVTSLPAYPCLVYVRHGEKAFTVTNYDGKETSYEDSHSLEDAIAEGHTHLAGKIREKEKEGGEFDPGVDYPDAIRRVDIQVPISDLVDSSTVMVDTPGLYSRMKFGYDLMTREFRDSAACAVFVVKTDNLYLEQVFAEFTDLLELFSRIFLVVNIDSSKRDLRPDGTLQPSLESQDPDKIIEAFENLAMDAQLKDALDEGKLRIYPIDLLNSAANHLQKASDDRADEAGDESELNTGSEDTDNTFTTFRQDLTEYLNSNEYSIAFMRDSLRQGSTICSETRRHCGPESLAVFAENQETLANQVLEAEQKLKAASNFRDLDNQHVFQRRGEECESKACRLAAELISAAPLKVESAVNNWSETDDSLRDLFQNYCLPILQEIVVLVDAETERHIQTLVGMQSSGADVSLEALEAIETLGIPLPEIGRTAAEEMKIAQQPEENRIDVRTESIPVRKSILDWIFFRNQEAVRRRLLGQEGDLSQPIPARAKSKRLGQDGLMAIQNLCIDWISQQQSQIPAAASDRAVGAYATGFLAELNRRVKLVETEQQEELGRLKAQIQSDERITKALGELRQMTLKIETRIAELGESYHCGENHLDHDHSNPSNPEPVQSNEETLVDASPLLGTIVP